MARSNDVQYIRYYSYGSAAEKVELPVKEKEKKKIMLPKPKLEQVGQKILKMDALALTGIAVAAVMLVCMLIGLVQVNLANARLHEAQVLVAGLEAEHDRLKTEYEHGYDLADIRVSAEAMGLVPVDQVRHVKLELSQPENAESTFWWENWLLEIKELFA